MVRWFHPGDRGESGPHGTSSPVHCIGSWPRGGQWSHHSDLGHTSNTRLSLEGSEVGREFPYKIPGKYHFQFGCTTPRKISSWKLKITQPWNGKSSEPNLHDFGFKSLIFQGVIVVLHRNLRANEATKIGLQISPAFVPVCGPVCRPLWPSSISIWLGGDPQHGGEGGTSGMDLAILVGGRKRGRDGKTLRWIPLWLA